MRQIRTTLFPFGCQVVELIEQNGQLSREYARVFADKVRLEEEIAEYKSNVAVLE